MQKRTLIIRFATIFILFILFIVAIVWRILYIQYWDDTNWLEVGDRYESHNDTIMPQRGSILADDGTELAVSAPKYYIRWDSKVEYLHLKKDSIFLSKVDSLADSLAYYFPQKKAEEHKRGLMKAFKDGNRNYKVLDSAVNFKQMEQIRKLPIFRLGKIRGGLKIEKSFNREHPYGILARRTIGDIYGSTSKGSSGLELYYDKELTGTLGIDIVETFETEVMNEVHIDAISGYDILTTINTHIQDIAQAQLKSTVERMNADWGCCIIMEVKTGEIKAIANLGLNKDGFYNERENYAVHRVEPGSTFKTMALMAALDEGKIKLTDSIDTNNGVWIYTDPKHPIKDSHAIKPRVITVKQAFAASSNIALAKITTRAFDHKPEKYVRKLESMGVVDSLQFEIPGTNEPLIRIPKDKETLARMAFGYYVEMPPVNIITFYNAIANDGRMMKPYLVKALQHNGQNIKTFGPKTIHSSICSKSTIADIKECLEAVVWDNEYGTASRTNWGTKKAQSDIVHIAGKTGTARILKNGIYDNNNHRITFCGYFPMEKPQYTCLFMVHYPKVPKDAGMDCGSAVRAIAQKVMAQDQMIPISNLYLPEDSTMLPPIKRGMNKSIRTATKGTQVPVKLSDDEWIRINENYEAEPLIVTKTEVPNVVGMGAKDAIYAIEQTGMIAQIKGVGRVRTQSIQPGTAAKKGHIVILELN
ncbi:MAG: transpeptidase family protein [Paludibacteraceae bacterium]|nr:transpeptidase family protein [Paludibacteraceae bacterium]